MPENAVMYDTGDASSSFDHSSSIGGLPPHIWIKISGNDGTGNHSWTQLDENAQPAANYTTAGFSLSGNLTSLWAYEPNGTNFSNGTVCRADLCPDMTHYLIVTSGAASGSLTLARIESVSFYPAGGDTFEGDGQGGDLNGNYGRGNTGFDANGTTWAGYYTAWAQQVTNDYVVANAAPPVHFPNVLAAWPSYFAVNDLVAVFPVQGYGSAGNEPMYAIPAGTSPRIIKFVADDTEGGVGTVYNATPADSIILVDAAGADTEVFLFQPYETNTRKQYTVKKIDPSVNTVFITGSGFPIDGAFSVTLTNQYDFVTVVGDGDNTTPCYWIVSYQIGGTEGGL